MVHSFLLAGSEASASLDRAETGRLGRPPYGTRRCYATEHSIVASELGQYHAGLGRAKCAMPVLLVVNPGEIPDRMHGSLTKNQTGPILSTGETAS